MRRAGWIGAVVAVSTFACVSRLPERPGRTEPPPAPLPEIHAAAPAPGMVWVPGTWHWDGSRYVWVPGRWESPPPLPSSS